MNDVNVELGNSGTATISLNDAAVRGLFAIASGTISLDDGHGKSNLAVYVTNPSANDSAVAPGAATTVVTFASDGTLQIVKYSTYADHAQHTISGQWKLSGASSAFQCKMHLDSGTTPSSGTMDTWQAMDTTRVWTLTFSGGSPGSATSNCTFKIRRTSDAVEILSVSITMTSTLT